MALTACIPGFEELWFKQNLLSDEETMAYNHAWGGTIAFPQERWNAWYDAWITHTDGRRYYRYLKDEAGRYVGEMAYHYDAEICGYLADVIVMAKYRGKGYGGEALEMLCSAARENGISALYDEIASDNPSVRLFLKHGFSVEDQTDDRILLKKELQAV